MQELLEHTPLDSAEDPLLPVVEGVGYLAAKALADTVPVPRSVAVTKLYPLLLASEETVDTTAAVAALHWRIRHMPMRQVAMELGLYLHQAQRLKVVLVLAGGSIEFPVINHRELMERVLSQFGELNNGD